MTDDAFNRQICYDRGIAITDSCITEKCLKTIQDAYCVRSMRQPKLGERADKYGPEVRPENE
jgi:hypothetical protein